MNVQRTIRLRPAVPEDARALARLIDIAGEGIPRWLWGRDHEPDRDPLATGEARARRDEGGFSYRNAIVAEAGGEPIGMVLGYPIEAADPDPEENLPAPIVPFARLESLSGGTWYVNALGVRPGCRNRGVGKQLLEAAETLARSRGYATTSIQVYSQNDGARRLYERLGYRVQARSPVLLHPCHPYYDEDVLLLFKNLGAPGGGAGNARGRKGDE